MTLSVHQDHDSYAQNPEWQEVERVTYSSDGVEPFQRIGYERVETTCLKPMRGWKATITQKDERTGKPWTRDCVHHGFCLLDKDHRGRHSTVVFYCDGCGKTRRGEPSARYPEQDVVFCFMCTERII